MLAEHTTLRVGGAPDAWITARSEHDVVEAVTDCDRRGLPVLLLGGGSNLVVGDAGFRGTVVEISPRGVDVAFDGSDVVVSAAAGA
jgi:UDP-N-acetylmuramate dehydrogenase